MLNLNLASPKVKKEVKLRRLNHLISRVAYPLVFLIFALAVYLAAGYFGLSLYLKKIEEQTSSAFLSDEGYDARLKSLNAEISFIEEIQNNHIAYASLFRRIVDLADYNLKFTVIQISRENNTIVLKGLAATRDSLLQFKKQLEDSKDFGSVNLPITSLLQKENINFEINAEVLRYED